MLGMNVALKSFCCAVGLALILSACAASDREAEEASISAALAESARSAQAGMDYKTAAAHFLKLYERQPDNFDALLGYARNLRYSGQPKEAIKVMKQGLGEHGEIGVLVLELAKAQLAVALFSDARENLDKVRQSLPESWEVFATTGILYDRLGRFDDARAEYERALDLFPGNVMVLNNMALSLAQAGKLDEAIAVLEKVVKSENSIIQVRQNLAMLYALKGDLKGAERLTKEDLPPEMVIENMESYRQMQ